MGWILPACGRECERDDCGNTHPARARGAEYVASNHNVFERFNRLNLELLGSAKGVEAQEGEGRGGGAGMDASGESGESFSEAKT